MFGIVFEMILSFAYSYRVLGSQREAIILTINRSRYWFYTSCTEYTGKVRNDNDVWECLDLDRGQRLCIGTLLANHMTYFPKKIMVPF